MVTDVRITIYDPKMAGVLALDASGDLGGSGVVLQYEDTPIGCGAAKITLGLRNEDVIARGIWGALNIVEISTGDDTLQAPIAGGATKLYVTSTDPWDPAKGEDAQLCYINGAHLTMRIPVTGIGSDGGGPFITVGAPLGGGSIPAEGAGAIIGRRRYCGRIVRRSRRNTKKPETPITLMGLGNWLKGNGSWTVANTDVGATIFNSLFQLNSRWPFFTISAGNFPVVGSSYTGSANRYDVSRFVADVLQSVTNGDVWVLRIGHDRTPRLIKLYTSASNTYTYTLTLPQGVTAFEPMDVLVEDDATNVFNSVEVIGDVDPVTKMNVAAIVQDAVSIGLYGQIDHDPVTNTKCKTQAQCVAAATALLNASSIASQNCGFRVFVRNDSAVSGAPLGVPNGDAVRGVASVTVSNNNAVGSVANNCPDSSLLVPSLWTAVSLAVGGVGPGGAQGWYGVSGYADAPAIAVAPGSRYTLSAYIGANAVSAGNPVVEAVTDVGIIAISQVGQAPGVNGRVVSGAFTIPPSATKMWVRFSTNGATTGGNIAFANPMLSRGDIDLPYVINNATLPPYGLVASANSSITADGDRWQDVKYAAIEPNFNAVIAERANATATALHSNTAQATYLDQYVVSATAFPPAVSTSSFTVTAPAFSALFATGTPPVAFAASSFTVIASNTNWAWLNPNGTWTVRQDATKVAGAIPYAYFQCSASGVMGWTQIASIGVALLFNAHAPKMPAGATFSVSAVTVTYGSWGSRIAAALAGISPTIRASCTISESNTPAMINWSDGYNVLVREHSATGLTDATTYDATPTLSVAIGNGTTLAFQYPVSLLKTFDVAIQILDGQGGICPSATTCVYLGTTSIGAGNLDPTTMPTPSTTPVLSLSANSVGALVSGATTYSVTAAFTAAITPAAPKWMDYLAVVYAPVGTSTPVNAFPELARIQGNTWADGAKTVIVNGLPAGSQWDVRLVMRDHQGIAYDGGLIGTTALQQISGGTIGGGAIKRRHFWGDTSGDDATAVIDSATNRLAFNVLIPAAIELNPYRNLVRNGNFQLAEALSTGGGWTQALGVAAMTSHAQAGTFGPLTIQQLVGVNPGGGIGQIIPVKPNTDYSFAMLGFAASQSMNVNVTNNAQTVGLGTNTQPSGALSATGFYLTNATLANSRSSSATGVWKLLSGRFNSGSYTSVTIIFTNTGGAAATLYCAGAMLWEGTKWQDYVDAEPVPGSILSAHLGAQTSSTPYNSQGSVNPLTTDAVLHLTGNKSNIAWVIDNGTDGQDAHYYQADGTSVTLPHSGTSASPNTIPASNAGGVSIYGFAYWSKLLGQWVCNARLTSPYTTTDFTACFADGSVPIFANGQTFGIPPSTTTGTGTTFGAYSSRAGCPAVGQLIRCKRFGGKRSRLVRAETVRVGDFLLDPDGAWNRVLRCGQGPAEIWELDLGDEAVRVDASHLFDLTGRGDWANVKADVHVGTELMRYGGGTMTVRRKLCLGMGRMVHLEVEGERYVLGRSVSHNVKIIGQPG